MVLKKDLRDLFGYDFKSRVRQVVSPRSHKPLCMGAIPIPAIISNGSNPNRRSVKPHLNQGLEVEAYCAIQFAPTI